MSGYPLKAVLDLRRRQEEAASARLADATRERATAEAEEARLRTRAVGARARWDDARGKDRDGSDNREDHDGHNGHDGHDGRATAVVTGAAATNRSRFVARCRHQVEQAEDALSAFQAGPLADARAAERTARDLHLTARLAREAFDKHAEKFRVAARRLAARREEETLEEAARASQRPRGNGRS